MKVIGQKKMIKEISKIIEIFKASEAAIRPHLILTGPSGSGKTLTVQSLADSLDLGFLEINAAQLTREGTSGNSLSKALSPLLQMGSRLSIVFVDEFDKLFITGNSNSDIAHETTTAVQNEFLKVLEADTTSVFGDYGKYISVSTKNVLFVFAGAFNGEEDITLDKLREFGLKTEFLGRVGLVYSTSKLSLEDMFEILEHSPLLEKYLMLFEKVDKEQCILTLKGHLQKTYEENTIGARAINTMIHQYFIKGGKLTDNDVKISQFSKKLKFD